MPRIHNVDGVRPQPIFVRTSHFNRSNQWKWHGYLKSFKRNRALGFVFNIQTSVCDAITVAKVSLFST